MAKSTQAQPRSSRAPAHRPSKRPPKRKMLGRYIVADPQICHGKPTFVGTRIMANLVIQQLARGLSWDRIFREWEGKVPKEAIAETLQLAHEAFVNHAVEYDLGCPPP